MSDDIVLLQCKLCSKPILQASFANHLERCKHLHPEQYQALTNKASASSPTEDEKSALTTPLTNLSSASSMSSLFPEATSAAVAAVATVKSEATKTPPRQPASGKRESMTPVQTEEDTVTSTAMPATAGKVKDKKRKAGAGPIDLDRQCGVLLAGSGGPCMRAITCKNHPVSAKRSVKGRSQDYDTLVALYQSELARGKEEKKLAAKDPNYAPLGKDTINLSDYKLSALDPDNEASAVLESIKKFQPQPVATRAPRFMRGRSLYNTFEAIKKALSGT
ncbi:SAGA complex subunit Sgf73 [Sorochytrium milnesiophthora]